MPALRLDWPYAFVFITSQTCASEVLFEWHQHPSFMRVKNRDNKQLSSKKKPHQIVTKQPEKRVRT